MGYRELYRDTNEEHRERLGLVRERIAEIAQEKAASVPETYRDYFIEMVEFFDVLFQLGRAAESGGLDTMTLGQGAELNALLYARVQEPGYEESYLNPAYAVKQMGKTYGQILSVLAAQLRTLISHAMEGNQRYLCIYAELFVEIFNCFEDSDSLNEKEIKSILYSFMHDYAEVFNEYRICSLLDAAFDFNLRLVMDSNLGNQTYLYRYGLCIGRDEITVAEFLNKLPVDKIQAMADTLSEGYRIGFEVTGKDLSKKSIVEIRYPVGFERMVRALVRNFEKLGQKSVLRPFSISLNKQYIYDHKEDSGLWLDKAMVERGLEVDRVVWEKNKERAPQYGGPAVIDVFGMEPFSPESKEERVTFSDKQQELSVHERSEKSRLTNQYIHAEEHSFSIIAYPVPSIGDNFAEIFAETVKINTLDYVLYRNMQQKIIDVLDTADYVHIKGMNGNKTDLRVKIYPLKNPGKETAFENCVADVNIPVGEVFTTPVLKGTEGKLHVTQVYLNELNYENLELYFSDGRITEYNCTNFSEEAKNKKYIEDNLLFHHKTLPMGEFAIGTNTMAYRMAKVFHIADKLPILIAEKTGPHFAVGDSCYTYEEDLVTYNPDGKAIVARDNEISILRKEDISKAYFNCHTDITIPYNELEVIEVVRADGTKEAVIKNGRFVLAGTEPLNEPLEKL